MDALEADLEDLEESVRAVEDAGSRWGMEEGEVSRRRRFVERVKGEVDVSCSPLDTFADILNETDILGSQTQSHGVERKGQSSGWGKI